MRIIPNLFVLTLASVGAGAVMAIHFWPEMVKDVIDWYHQMVVSDSLSQDQ